MLTLEPTREKAYALPVSTQLAKHPLLLLSRGGAGDAATPALLAAGTKDSSEGWKVCWRTFYHREDSALF